MPSSLEGKTKKPLASGASFHDRTKKRNEEGTGAVPEQNLSSLAECAGFPENLRRGCKGPGKRFRHTMAYVLENYEDDPTRRTPTLKGWAAD